MNELNLLEQGAIFLTVALGKRVDEMADSIEQVKSHRAVLTAIKTQSDVISDMYKLGNMDDLRLKQLAGLQQDHRRINNHVHVRLL